MSVLTINKCLLTSTIPEAMQALQMGIQDKMRSTSQQVQFIIQLSKPCTDVKWFKTNKQIETGGKFRVFFEDNGLKHVMEVEGVQNEDEGVYSFHISEDAATSGDQVVVKGRVVDKSHLENIMLQNIGAQEDKDLKDATLMNMGSF